MLRRQFLGMLPIPFFGASKQTAEVKDDDYWIQKAIEAPVLGLAWLTDEGRASDTVVYKLLNNDYNRPNEGKKILLGQQLTKRFIELACSNKLISSLISKDCKIFIFVYVDDSASAVIQYPNQNSYWKAQGNLLVLKL